MKDIRERIKTVQELLTHAQLIRTKAAPAAANEATEIEIELTRRLERLQLRLVENRVEEKKKKQLELVNA